MREWRRSTQNFVGFQGQKFLKMPRFSKNVWALKGKKFTPRKRQEIHCHWQEISTVTSFADSATKATPHAHTRFKNVPGHNKKLVGRYRICWSHFSTKIGSFTGRNFQKCRVFKVKQMPQGDTTARRQTRVFAFCSKIHNKKRPN